ncbi:hypothetical protein [Leptolyngbya iicbica]|uniref:Uncharacterized protein n=2 Tax=Cyanophyceae TaxID=3028117 RepID=A0A4Q7EG47_9CYAN|nr:hypothetical protein [Leptolyngbya sp. LK]RZM82057.1 hypothetical protein DYY88_01975 [Leptolyngbya sp. LK]
MVRTSDTRTRSLTLILLVLVQGAVSLLALASGIFLVLLMTGAVQVLSQDLQSLTLPLKGLIAVGLAISGFGLVVTYGLWQLKPWGWTGSLIFQILCIANNGLTLLVGQELSPQVYFSVAFSGTLIAALFLPNVQELCVPTTPESSDSTPPTA